MNRLESGDWGGTRALAGVNKWWVLRSGATRCKCAAQGASTLFENGSHHVDPPPLRVSAPRQCHMPLPTRSCPAPPLDRPPPRPAPPPSRPVCRYLKKAAQARRKEEEVLALDDEDRMSQVRGWVSGCVWVGVGVGVGVGMGVGGWVWMWMCEGGWVDGCGWVRVGGCGCGLEGG